MQRKERGRKRDGRTRGGTTKNLEGLIRIISNQKRKEEKRMYRFQAPEKEGGTLSITNPK